MLFHGMEVLLKKNLIISKIVSIAAIFQPSQYLISSYGLDTTKLKCTAVIIDILRFCKDKLLEKFFASFLYEEKYDLVLPALAHLHHIMTNQFGFDVSTPN